MTMAGERIERIAADQFNHCVTVWRKPDRTTVLLDPTWIPGAREMWSSREQQQEVLMGLPEGADLLTTPVSAPESHPLDVSIRSTLAPDGTLTGVMKVTADGQSDAGLRRLYRGRLRSDWPAVDEAMLTSVDPRAELTAVTRSDPDDLRTPFAMEVTFRIDAYARRLDDGSLLLTPLAARHPVGQAAHAEEIALSTKPAERKYPVRIGCSKLVTLTERLTLPPGATVKGLPDPVKLDGSGTFAASWRLAGGDLVGRGNARPHQAHLRSRGVAVAAVRPRGVPHPFRDSHRGRPRPARKGACVMLPRISPRNAALTPIVFAVLAATAALAAAPLRAASTPSAVADDPAEGVRRRARARRRVPLARGPLHAARRRRGRPRAPLAAAGQLLPRHQPQVRRDQGAVRPRNRHLRGARQPHAPSVRSGRRGPRQRRGRRPAGGR